MENLNQLVDKIQPAIQQLAEQLGIASEFVWEILIRQQYIDGYMAILWAVIGAIVVITGIKLMKPTIKVIEESDIGVLALICVVFLIIVGFFIFVNSIGIAVNHLVNPQYQALKDILEMVSGVK